MRKIKDGDLIKIKQLDSYREGMVGYDFDREETYTTKYEILQITYIETDNPCVQIRISDRTGLWWLRCSDVELVPKRNVIGGKML